VRRTIFRVTWVAVGGGGSLTFFGIRGALSGFDRAEELSEGYVLHPSGTSLLGADGGERPIELAVFCFGPTPEDVQRTCALIGESRLID